MSQQLFSQQLERLQALKEHDIDPYIDKAIHDNTTIAMLKKQFSQYTKDELVTLPSAAKEVCLSGRIILIRKQGGITFINMRNDNLSIQIFLKKNLLASNKFYLASKLCIGDIINVYGTIMKTHTGVLTIRCYSLDLESLALLSLPTKTRISKNGVELQYRQRYLDTLTNEKSFIVLQTRSLIIRKIREFLHKDNFIEVETPILETIYGGAIAKPFTTYHSELKQNFFLRVSEEIALKKLIIGGFNRVFEIGKIFRNEGISPHHNPEFTLLEWYQAYATLADTKRKCRLLFQHLAIQLYNSLVFVHGDHEINLADDGWTTITMAASIAQKTTVDFNKITTIDEAKKMATKHNVPYIDDRFLTIGKVMDAFFQTYVESTLINPTFISEFPIDISPLAKKIKNNPRFTQRFELYINGCEMANAFNELTDYFDQKERLEKQKSCFVEFSQLKEIDQSFLEALKYGMPPTSGIGIGIDRLVMLFTNSCTIKQVIFFPTLRKQIND